MTKETIGLVTILCASGQALASPIAPTFGGAELAADIDLPAELLAPAAYTPADQPEHDIELFGHSPVKDPPTSLPGLRPSEPGHGAGSFVSMFDSDVSTQPVDTFYNIDDTPGTTVIAIPLPAGAGLATAGLGLLALRRRR